MSENTETQPEAPAGEKTFGFDARPALEARREAYRTANQEHDAATELINGPLNAAERAVHNLLGQHSTEAVALSDLLAVLSKGKRQAALDTAQATRAEAFEAAQEALGKATGDDPFVKFVTEDGNITTADANAIFETAPHTFTSLKNLAKEHSWCEEFEHTAARAVEAGALPDEKVTLTRPCSWSQVPPSYEAGYGEKWEVEFQVPAFVRTTHYDGDTKDLDEILFVSGDLTYRKVADSPSQD
jgi:hypothetical protein